ncbi:MAG: CPBP family intramembrane glutamic endopeptidase [Cyclobacteriaceae bacterium]
MISRKAIFRLATLTLLGFGGLGLLLIGYSSKPFLETIFSGPSTWYIQSAAGLLYGGIAALVAWSIVSLPLLSATRSFFVNLIQPLHLSWSAIIYISFCAGVGEELFFRGALQPYLGIWWTSIVFVALHGYLNPWNWRLSLYGLFMTLAIAGLGYLTEYLGLLSAMVAHTVIDVYLLRRLTINN